MSFKQLEASCLLHRHTSNSHQLFNPLHKIAKRRKKRGSEGEKKQLRLIKKRVKTKKSPNLPNHKKEDKIQVAPAAATTKLLTRKRKQSSFIVSLI